jgi:hypothetical protein
MKDKNLEKKVFSKFRFSLGLVGFMTSVYVFHKIMCKNNPELVRKMYFDRLFNYNDTWQQENKRDNIVRI